MYTTFHLLRTGVSSTMTQHAKKPMKISLCAYHLGRRKVNDKDFTYTQDTEKQTTVSERIECQDCNDQISRGSKFLAENPNALDKLTK